jgi:hypothetical protein
MAIKNTESGGHIDIIEDTEDFRAKSKEAGVFEGNVDYSGASAKVDPVEISLVRKLDWRIMPTLWAMYFLNYVGSSKLPHNLVVNII